MALPGLARTAAGSARGGGVLTAAMGLLLASVVSCAPRLAVRPQVLAGSFSGATEDGEAVVVTFREDREAFLGEGTIAGEPIVVAGAAGWRGVGSLQGAEGGAELVELSLSADGETVTIERRGRQALTLERGGAPPAPSSPGPFTGRFRAERDGAPLAEVTLVHRGSLLSGVGIVTGDPVGIAGRSTGPRQASGVVTFLDGSQMGFTAELAPGGESLSVRGFGEPVTMKRKGRP